MVQKISCVVIGFFLIFLASGCDQSATVEAVVRPVRAVLAGDSSQFLGRWYPGQAKATQEVNIAFEVPGQLIERPVNVGDKVEKGQVLARLDPRDYQNDFEAAQARLEQAKAYQERIEIAAKTGAVSQQELTDAVARFDVAKADLSIKQKAIADTRIVAPFSGTIAATYVENFQNVRMKQPVLRLLDASKVEMTINIPESAISFAPHVKEIKCRFEAFPGREIPAELKEIGTEASETTRTYPITLIMDQPKDFKVLPGMTGEATATRSDAPATADEGVVHIPLAAVFEDESGKSHVWILEDLEASTKKAKHQEVTIVELTSVGVQVKGIQKGQWIATAGVHYLEEGQTVQVLGEETGEVSK